jgi:hypothetical protein
MSVCPNVTSEKIINTFHYCSHPGATLKTSWDNFNFVRCWLNLAHSISKWRHTHYRDCVHLNRRTFVVFIPTHEIKIQQKLSWHRYAFSTFYDHNAVPHFRTKERVLNWHIGTITHGFHCLIAFRDHTAIPHTETSLCYKPEGRGLDSRLGNWNYPLI